jgi:thiamine biosynthesis lipoprotein
VPSGVDVMGEAHEFSFAAMGTTCQVVVHGRPSLVDVAARRIAELERAWSRFLPDSDVSRLNGATGRPVAVGNDTFLLVSRAVESWRLTDGRYDPTVLRALLAAGYDRSFADPASGVHHPEQPAGPATAAPGCAGIEIDPYLHTVRLPDGVLFDGGGIGKGLAADLVVEELLDAGAYGACVNMGGDARVGGEAPTEHGWVLGVADPYDADRLVPVRIEDGAVVTSTRLMRQWRKGERRYHHLIDPRTGAPVDNGVDAVTVIAGRAWWAEVLAKAALVAGMPAATDLLARARATGLVVAGVGQYYELPGWTGFVQVLVTPAAS